jgi:5-formyltetrahydrofolate cyclo-ligase
MSDRPALPVIPVSASDDKVALRRMLAARRRQISPDVHEAIAAHAVAWMMERKPRIVQVYLEQPGSGEVGTDTILRAAIEAGIRIAVPVVDPIENRRMRLVGWQPDAPMRLNRFGIPEPETGEDIGRMDVDLWFVPALGADRSGSRIGHGAGYYDRILAGVGGFKVALVPEICVVDAIPAEAHDVRMDAVVTESGVNRSYL